MHLYKNSSSTRGFTIVELLIVIVVIGILAAITIVAYNGVQQQARNASRTSAAASTAKLLSNYVATHNSYPTFSGNRVCISGYPESNECVQAGDIVVPKSDSFETALKTSGSIPQFLTKPVGGRTGLVMIRNTSYTVNGQPSHYILQWLLEGNDLNCNVSGSLVGAGTSTSFTYGKNSSTWSGVTQCSVALPMPE